MSEKRHKKLEKVSMDDKLLAKARALINALNPSSEASVTVTKKNETPQQHASTLESNMGSPAKTSATSFTAAAIAGSSLITTFNCDLRNYIDRGDFIVIDGIKCKTADSGEFTANRIELAQDYPGETNMNAVLTFTKSNKQRTVKVSRVRVAKDINLSEISKVVETLTDITKKYKAKDNLHPDHRQQQQQTSNRLDKVTTTVKKISHLPRLQQDVVPSTNCNNNGKDNTTTATTTYSVQPIAREKESDVTSSALRYTTATTAVTITDKENSKTDKNVADLVGRQHSTGSEAKSLISSSPRSIGDIGYKAVDSYMSAYLQGGLDKDRASKEGREKIVRRMRQKMREDEERKVEQHERERRLKDASAEGSQSRVESFRQKTLDRVLKLKEEQRVRSEQLAREQEKERAMKETREAERTAAHKLENLRSIRAATAARVRGRMLASLRRQEEEETERQRRIETHALHTLRRLPTADLILLGPTTTATGNNNNNTNGSGNDRGKLDRASSYFNDDASETSSYVFKRMSSSAGQAAYSCSSSTAATADRTDSIIRNGNQQLNSSGHQRLREVQKQLLREEEEEVQNFPRGYENGGGEDVRYHGYHYERATSLPSLPALTQPPHQQPYHIFDAQRQNVMSSYVPQPGGGHGDRRNNKNLLEQNEDNDEEEWSDDSMQEYPPPSSSQYHALMDIDYDESNHSHDRSSAIAGSVGVSKSQGNAHIHHGIGGEEEEEQDLRAARLLLRNEKMRVKIPKIAPTTSTATSVAHTATHSWGVLNSKQQQQPRPNHRTTAPSVPPPSRIPISTRIPKAKSSTNFPSPHSPSATAIPAALPRSPHFSAAAAIASEDPLERVSMMSDLSNYSVGSPARDHKLRTKAGLKDGADSTGSKEGGTSDGVSKKKKSCSYIWRKLKPIPIQPFLALPLTI